MKNFKDLDLHPGIQKAIDDEGFETPTPIQIEAIPKVRQGFDLRCSAQTGSGKTAAFLIPAIERLIVPSTAPGIGPRVLILAPTRELAMQIANEAAKYSKHLPRMKTVCIYGGAPFPPQNKALSRHYEILVATPGRLIDHMERGRIKLDRVEILILDEADRMLDMGFIEPVEQIAAATPKTRQTLMFSATLKGSVMKLSDRLLRKPQEISVIAEFDKHENIDQRLHYVDNIQHKNRLLEHLLNDTTIKQAIVFTATKRHADQLVENLYEVGHRAAALHGDMNQRQRTRTILKMREGEIKILVATDVAARGIDVQTITHVINFDLPNNAEDYVHRIGRTGRAGQSGIALSFVAASDLAVLKDIEKITGQKTIFSTVPGMEPRSTPPLKAPPAAKRGFGRKSGGSSRGPGGNSRGPGGGSRGGSSSPRGKGGFGDKRGPKPEGSSFSKKPRFSGNRERA